MLQGVREYNVSGNYFAWVIGMKEDQKSNQVYDQTGHGVCAWCHWLYVKTTGLQIRFLSSIEYAKIQSHGLCKVCKEGELQCLE